MRFCQVAGHAFVNEKLGNPRGRLEWLTIVQAGDAGGYARYSEPQKRTHTRESIVWKLAVLAGGMAAQELYGMERDSGWSKDLQQMRALAQKAVLHYGLSPTLDAFPDLSENADLSKLSAAQRRIVHAETEKLMNEAKRLASEVLSKAEARAVLDELVRRLLQEGSLSGEAVSKLLK